MKRCSENAKKSIVFCSKHWWKNFHERGYMRGCKPSACNFTKRHFAIVISFKFSEIFECFAEIYWIAVSVMAALCLKSFFQNLCSETRSFLQSPPPPLNLSQNCAPPPPFFFFPSPHWTLTICFPPFLWFPPLIYNIQISPHPKFSTYI